MCKTSIIKSSFQRVKLNHVNKNQSLQYAFEWNKIRHFLCISLLKRRLVQFSLPFVSEMRFQCKLKRPAFILDRSYLRAPAGFVLPLSSAIFMKYNMANKEILS